MAHRASWLILALFACSGSGSSSATLAPSASSAAADAGDTSPSSAIPLSQSQTITCAGLVPDTGVRDAAFRMLSSYTWETESCGYSSTYAPCTTLTLEPRGGYTLVTTNESPLRGDSGSWNFAAIDAKHGVLCLDGRSATPLAQGGESDLPSALAFTIDDTFTLNAGPFAFSRRTGRVGGSGGSAAALVDVHVPEGFGRIVNKTWKKTNSFDLFMSAEEIAFDGLGAFRASYRGGSCTHGGRVSWDKDTLIPTSDTNTCDQREGGVTAQISTANVTPGFLDDILVLTQASYRPATAAAGKSHFIFDPYGRSLEVHGVFDEPLRAGAPSVVALTFANVDPLLSRNLSKVTLALQPASLGGGGFQTAGPRTVVATRDYTGTTIAPGATFSDAVTFTPPAAGATFALTIEIDYADARQTYIGPHTYITSILQ